MNNVLDPKVMTEFSANLGTFNKAMKAAGTEIETILRTPGIESENITAELNNLKTKLENMSAKWDEIADRFNKNLNISIADAERLQTNIKATLETN